MKVGGCYGAGSSPWRAVLPGIHKYAQVLFLATTIPQVLCQSSDKFTCHQNFQSAARWPAYMAMFLAMGLGTSAAKTSFFGSLQAVVCAGTGGFRGWLLLVLSQLDVSKPFPSLLITTTTFCRDGFTRIRWFGHVWPMCNKMNEAALHSPLIFLAMATVAHPIEIPQGITCVVARQFKIGTLAAAALAVAGAVSVWWLRDAVRAYKGCYGFLVEVWFQSIVVHTLIPNMTFIGFCDGFDFFKQLAVRIILKLSESRTPPADRCCGRPQSLGPLTPSNVARSWHLGVRRGRCTRAGAR